MKKFNLMMSLLFVGAAFSPAFAQSGDKNLKTLLSPDKVWYNVISISNNYPDYVRSSDGGVSPFTFEGTEERNGHVYTRMVTEDNPDEAILLMREEDGKVYFTLPWDYSEEALYCDFNLEAGDAFESYFAHPDWDRPNVLIPSYVIIEKTGYIELNGQSLRFLKVNVRVAGNTSCYYIEGIGTFDYQSFLFPCGDLTTGFNHVDGYFGEIRDRTTGEVIVTSSEISEALKEAGIDEVADGRPADGKMYDLTGREIKHPLPGTVYIRDGRKHVAR